MAARASRVFMGTTIRMKRTMWVQTLLLGGLAITLLTGCKSANATSSTAAAAVTAANLPRIYVEDFELGAQIQHEDGTLSARRGALGRVGDRLSGGSEDPAARAQQIVELMSTSLVKSLNKQGFTASRLAPGSVLPRDGWLIRGIFTEVQEGNRLKRAMIGFGKGQTDIQVVTRIDNLSLGKPEPLYQLAADASSGSKPGAAPTLVLGPYGAAARFVMAGKDLDKNVKQTAEQIAERLRQRYDDGK